jgi:hypothetical protein
VVVATLFPLLNFSHEPIKAPPRIRHHPIFVLVMTL